MTHRYAVALGFALAVTAGVVAFAQPPETGGPLSNPYVLGAPFSADATTTVRQTHANGTQVQRRQTARYYRDSAGRVRVEQVVRGTDALDSTADGRTRISLLFTEPDGRLQLYMLDPPNLRAHYGPRSMVSQTVGGGDAFSVPMGDSRWSFVTFERGSLLVWHGASVVEQPLGTSQINGIPVVGRRVVATIPAGMYGNKEPYAITDDRWESPELKLLLFARSSDPRMRIDIEYSLANVSRAEPRADLFVLPSEYTVVVGGDAGATGLIFGNNPNAYLNPMAEGISVQAGR